MPKTGIFVRFQTYLKLFKINYKFFQSLIIFYRCLPHDSRLPLLIDAYNTTRTFFEDVLSDLSLCWKEMTYLCSISFVFSLIILILLRYLANIIIWITLFAMSLTAVSGSAYIWYIISFIVLLDETNYPLINN